MQENEDKLKMIADLRDRGLLVTDAKIAADYYEEVIMSKVNEALLGFAKSIENNYPKQ